MRVLKHRKTGRIIEAQGGGDESHLDVLYANAKSAGYAKKDVEAVMMTDAEFRAELTRQNEADMDYRQKRAADYPSITDQLDALYHAGVFPEEMAARIKSVKDKFPKV